MSGETRADRANRIREPVRALVDRSSLQQAADAISNAAGETISIGAIRSLLNGSTPREQQLRIYEAWARAAGVLFLDMPSAGGRPRWLDDKTIGERIRQIRRRRGWSQQRLANYLEIPSSQADVSRWERGKRPGYDILEAIARLVGEHADIFQEAGELSLGSVAERSLHEYGTPLSDDDAVAAEALADVEETTRFLEGIAPAGQGRELKIDVLELVKRMILKRESALPGWWYRLRGMVEDGAI